MAAPLAALAVLLAFGALWELAGRADTPHSLREALAGLVSGRGRWAAAGLRFDIPRRLARAGLPHIPVWAVLAAKAGGVVIGVGLALLAAPVVPGRLSIPVAVLMPAAGFIAPEAWLEREARRRTRRLVAALPDALDLMAVGAASGRSPGAVLADIAGSSEGPLAVEVGIAAAELACGASQAEALATLRGRIPGGEVAALVAAINRSRLHGRSRPGTRSCATSACWRRSHRSIR